MTPPPSLNLGLLVKDKVTMKKSEQIQYFFFFASVVIVRTLGCLGTESKLFKSRIFFESLPGVDVWVQREIFSEINILQNVVEVNGRVC